MLGVILVFKGTYFSYNMAAKLRQPLHLCSGKWLQSVPVLEEILVLLELTKDEGVSLM